MPTIEEIITRATAIGLPITKNAWKKTAKKPVPDPPYIVYLVSENQRGNDKKNTIREIDGSLELYTDRTPDESLERQIEEEVLFDLPFEKYQADITSENMVQTAYEFNITQKGRKQKWQRQKELFSDLETST